MDDKWIYGAHPAQIYSSIVQGRPNGMPAFADRVPEQQVWQLVAYVQIDVRQRSEGCGAVQK